MRASLMVTQRLVEELGWALDSHLPVGLLALWNSPTPGFQSCLCQSEGPRLGLCS